MLLFMQGIEGFQFSLKPPKLQQVGGSLWIILYPVFPGLLQVTAFKVQQARELSCGMFYHRGYSILGLTKHWPVPSLSPLGKLFPLPGACSPIHKKISNSTMGILLYLPKH